MFVLQCINFTGVVSIFLCAILLQIDSATECIDNSTFRVDSPTKPILPVFTPTNRWSYTTVGLSIVVKTSVSYVLLYITLSIWQSRPVYHKSYFLMDYQYTSRDQCIISPTFCRTINTLVETSLALVLLPVLLLIHYSRKFFPQSYILQCYRYNSQYQCVVSSSEMREFFILKTFQVLYHHMETLSWCLVQGPDIYLTQKYLHKIAKKTGFFLYFNFISFFFASIIPKMTIEREKKL